MTLSAGGAGFEGRTAGGQPGAWPPLRTFIEGLVAPVGAA
jgi:hypothetical protein